MPFDLRTCWSVVVVPHGRGCGCARLGAALCGWLCRIRALADKEEEVPVPDAEALTTTPVGLALLAELAGLDRWDFLDQIVARMKITPVLDGDRLSLPSIESPRPPSTSATGQEPEMDDRAVAYWHAVPRREIVGFVYAALLLAR